MPLSEEELRLLEQMERALVAEDPKKPMGVHGVVTFEGKRPERRPIWMPRGPRAEDHCAELHKKPLWPRIMDKRFVLDGKEYLFPA